MIQKMKKHLLQLVGMLALLVGVTSCEGWEIIGGGGSQETPVELTRCWHMVSFCDAPADVDIYIDFGKDGNFAIYQRSKELSYTVFNGTYTNDEENSVIAGVYDDGTPWLSSYYYVVDKEAKSLTLTSVETPSEVAVYELAEVPASATLSSRSASVNDVKPL